MLGVANLVALIASYDPDEGGKTASTLLGTVILAVVAVGMWRVRYWAVLGMQALLAITIVLGCLALLTAENLAAVLLVARDARGLPARSSGSSSRRWRGSRCPRGPAPSASGSGRRRSSCSPGTSGRRCGRP